MRTALTSIVFALAVAGFAQDGDWSEIASWNGTGTRTTETFTIDGFFWRIRYGTMGNSGPFSIRVYEASGEIYATPVNVVTEGPADGIVRMARDGAGPGFYLEISATGPEWSVVVEEEQ